MPNGDLHKMIERFKRVPHTWEPTGMSLAALKHYTYAPGHQNARWANCYGTKKPVQCPRVSPSGSHLHCWWNGADQNGWVYSLGTDTWYPKHAMFYFE